MPSMRAAVNAKCKDCIYDEAEPGNWRQQVTACTSDDCALHPIRPVSKSKAKSGPQSTEEAIP